MRTSLYSILCIVIRLGAVILAAQLVVSLPGTVDSILHSVGFQPGLQQALLSFYAVFFLAATALWIYPGVLARLAAGESSKQVFEASLAPEECQYIALSVLGVYFALTGVSDLLGVGVRIVASMHVGEVASRELMSREVVRLVPPLVKIALGMGLAFGARGLIGWLRAIRQRGLPAAVEEAEESANGSAR